MIARTSDFLGVNSYTTKFVQHSVNDDPSKTGDDARFDLSYDNDQDLHSISPDQIDASIKQKYPGWLWSIPWGMRRLLNWYYVEYGRIPLIVTENGMGSEGDDMNVVDDFDRAMFYKQYINECLKAHKLDGVEIFGYTGWFFKTSDLGAKMPNLEVKNFILSHFWVIWGNFRSF